MAFGIEKESDILGKVSDVTHIQRMGVGDGFTDCKSSQTGVWGACVKCLSLVKKKMKETLLILPNQIPSLLKQKSDEVVYEP